MSKRYRLGIHKKKKQNYIATISSYCFYRLEKLKKIYNFEYAASFRKATVNISSHKIRDETALTYELDNISYIRDAFRPYEGNHL